MSKNISLEEFRRDHYSAFTIATMKNNVELLIKYLELFGKEEFLKAFSAANYDAYYRACGKGAVECLKFFHSIISLEELNKAFSTADYSAYKAAWSNFNFSQSENLKETVKLLESIFGSPINIKV